MNIKRILAAGVVAAAGVLPAQQMDIVAEEPPVFRKGQEIRFTATARKENKALLREGSVVFSFKDSGGKRFRGDLTVDLSKENPAKFTVKLDHPGFVLVSASPGKLSDGSTVKWSTAPFAPLGGAAVEPERIRPGTACPADFDEFWRKGIESFKNAKVEVTDAPGFKREGYKVSRIRISFPDGTGSVTGFLSIPSKPGKYPALAGVPGAGPGKADPVPFWNSPLPAIELWLNVHNFVTGSTQKEQQTRYAAYIRSLGGAYWFTNAADRDRYFFRNVWLAVNRAVDFVAALPEFDGKHFAMAGNSQGGGTALAIGSLNQNITCIVASVPALCDHGGWKLGRQAGWPRLHANLKGKADAAAPYFDAAYFAARVKVPTLISVGFVDTTCSPASVYAAYNSIPADVPKRIYHMHRQGHRGTPAFRPEVQKFLKEQFGK